MAHVPETQVLGAGHAFWFMAIQKKNCPVVRLLPPSVPAIGKIGKIPDIRPVCVSKILT